MQILCSPGQARVISNEYRDRIQILRSDDRRGAYVAVIVNEINGKGMTIMADPDMPDGDAWLLDTNCFALANLSGRAISLLKTLRDQRYFEKPCVKARKKSARARIRNRSRRGRMELN